MTAQADTYHPLSRFLHWLVAALIVVQYVLAQLAERAEHADATVRLLGLVANHKSVGMTVLALVAFRLVWRFLKPVPALPPMPSWQITASKVSHGLLYALLLALPLTGWLMSSASAYSVSWFNLFQIPDLIGPDADLKGTLETIHEILAKALFVMAVIHVLAALKHFVVDRDGVLERMSSTASVLLFFAVSGAGIYLLSDTGGKARSSVPAAPAAAPAVATEPGTTSSNDATAEASASNLPAWQIDYETSFIRFVGDQAGAEFDGRWTAWAADIRFADDQLDAARFDVRIDVRQVDTGDTDRDATMQDPDWFDSANHPFAYYRASNFGRSDDDGFVARGELTIKELTAPVALTFKVTEDDGQRVLEGTGQARLLEGNALLDRLALKLGTGDWEDTTWVGQEVQVEVKVVATVE
ncbi:MAG: cytochrome b/b6 domain-containing protein [Pseudomonadota bacterium]